MSVYSEWAPIKAAFLPHINVFIRGGAGEVASHSYGPRACPSLHPTWARQLRLPHILCFFFLGLQAAQRGKWWGPGTWAVLTYEGKWYCVVLQLT